MVAAAEQDVSERLLNRELSTLEYNARLLDLVADDTLPLLERVKMCRFFSSNLDEFFMVRVAGLLGLDAAWDRRSLGGRADAARRAGAGSASGYSS